MADLTITISNHISPVGPGAATQWGAFLWGQSDWGSAGDSLQAVDKLISNSEALTSAMLFDATHAISEQLSLDSAVSNSAIKVISNSLAVVSETTNQQLKSGSWNYVFTGPTTDSDDRSITQYTEVDPTGPTWTSAAAVSTTWSES